MPRMVQQPSMNNPDASVAQLFGGTPFIGQIVHYVGLSLPSPDGLPCQAAIVTDRGRKGVGVLSGVVTLLVFQAAAQLVVYDVSYDEDKRPGTWHYIEMPAWQAAGTTRCQG